MDNLYEVTEAERNAEWKACIDGVKAFANEHGVALKQEAPEVYDLLEWLGEQDPSIFEETVQTKLVRGIFGKGAAYVEGLFKTMLESFKAVKPETINNETEETEGA